MRPPALRVHCDGLIVDNFAGGGGASVGIEWALGRSPDLAVNHDPEAVAMHAANHPQTRHLLSNVWDVDPVEACGGRPVALAWFSPDCTFHSKARGGKPFRDADKAKRRRGLAWVVIRWARAVHPRVICLENVEEFQDWGPLDSDGKPDPLRRGFTFRRWVAQLENCGYAVEMRELRACDYGAPTSRKRLFVIARCDGQPIVWPVATHGPGRKPYRTAAECLDWTLPCPSIFERAQPLAENTLRRIARGLRRYVIEAAEPFIVGVGGRQGQSVERSVFRPYQTITAKGDSAIVEPFLVEYHAARRAGDERARAVNAPLPTQDTSNRFGLVAPTLIQSGWGEREGQAPRVLDIGKPLGVIPAEGVKQALVSAFLARHYGGHENSGAPVAATLPTITTQDHHALVASHLLHLRGGLADHPVTARDLRALVPTITASGTHLAEVRAFLIAYFGTDGDPRLRDPLHTVTTHDRFGLVTVKGVEYAIADIGMRMLAPRELYRAQGFPSDYRIQLEVDGRPLSKAAQVRMVGNSVCPPIACALVRANVATQAAQTDLFEAAL